MAWMVRHFFFFRFWGAIERAAKNDFAHIDMLMRRWSPGWDVPPDETLKVKESFRQPGSLAAAIGYYREQRAAQIECAASDPVFVALLERALFLKRSQLPFAMACEKKYRFPDTLREIKNWHLSYGDSEGPY